VDHALSDRARLWPPVLLHRYALAFPSIQFMKELVRFLNLGPPWISFLFAVGEI
jgi:hypothetical protein